MARSSIPAARRIDAIDQFRGFAIILMVIFNSLAGIFGLPGIACWYIEAPCG